MFTCKSSPCLLSGRTINLGNSRSPQHVSDISHLHQCEQAIAFRLAARNAMRDNNRGCRYGCSRLPCLHGATIRFPSMNSTRRAPETYEKNPPSAIGDALRAGLYSKPLRQLRDYADAQRSASSEWCNLPTIGIRADSPNADGSAATAVCIEPATETLAASNVERIATDSSEFTIAVSTVSSEIESE
jgi:hypothetical protein